MRRAGISYTFRFPSATITFFVASRACLRSALIDRACVMFGQGFCPLRGILHISLLFSTTAGSPLIARSPPSTDHARDLTATGEALLRDSAYNDGSYGRYVTQTFKSSNVSATRINMMQPFTGCDDGSYLFVTPRGEDVEQPAAAIYDPRYPQETAIWTWNRC